MDRVITVSDLNRYISSIFSHDYNLSNITVSGEISGCKIAASGHIYFNIKDEKSQLTCVMFAGKTASLNFVPENGMEVLVTGSVSVYERDGKYQLYADKMIKAGMGVLFEQVEALKRKLRDEGLFDVDKKKRIPPYIKTLGVVTSSTGAVIHDICTVSGRRNPYVQIILCPASVQGAEAPASIIKGIKRLDSLKPDCIIVGRGGGSFEDLMCFNDEGVARAIYECSTPVISAVGHETDFTIADMVADRRAATPSEAAELAVYDIDELFDTLSGFHFEMQTEMTNRIRNLKLMLQTAQAELTAFSPKSRLERISHELEIGRGKLEYLMNNKLERKKYELNLLKTSLTSMNPSAKLSQGYSFVADSEGKNITSVKQVAEGDRLTVYVTDGTIEVRAERTVISDKGRT